MEFIEIITESIGTLRLNKMRTGLAALGIIIGITSVIALISLGQGSQKSIENQIQSLGSNLLTVNPRGQSTGPVQAAGGSGTSLTLDDAKALASTSQLTTIKSVSPEYSGRAQVMAGRNNTNTQIIGAYPQYADIRKISVQSGSFISQRDVEAIAKVAVIGPQAAADLFSEGTNPVGQNIRVNGQTLRIVGLTAEKGGSGFNNPDNAIYVPLSTAQKQLFGATHLTSIGVEATSPDVMTQAQNEIGYFLLSQHKLKDPADADTALLSGIAAISLLVGGIGIMNIMLVTVTERTREIGLRKALGAKKRIIVRQFLTEAILLTLIGGFVGMIVGIVISYVLSNIINLPFVIAVTSIVLAIGVSGAIGIIFGWYPAQKAANLQPIEALRYE